MFTIKISHRNTNFSWNKRAALELVDLAFKFCIANMRAASDGHSSTTECQSECQTILQDQSRPAMVITLGSDVSDFCSCSFDSESAKSLFMDSDASKD